MLGSSRLALPDVREWSRVSFGCLGVVEALTDIREWSGGPPRCPGMVGRPSQMFEVVGRPSQMSLSGRKTLPNVPEW